MAARAAPRTGRSACAVVRGELGRDFVVARGTWGGAGDALAAAFVWAIEKKNSFTDALRWGVAAGTAKASLPGMSFPTLEQTRAIYQQVDVRPAR